VRVRRRDHQPGWPLALQMASLFRQVEVIQGYGFLCPCAQFRRWYGTNQSETSLHLTDDIKQSLR
jgi:hypothetical protein